MGIVGELEFTGLSSGGLFNLKVTMVMGRGQAGEGLASIDLSLEFCEFLIGLLGHGVNLD